MSERFSEDAVLFSRSSLGGKKSSEVRARVTDELKFSLQRRCNELGITESEYIDTLLSVSLYGEDKVLTAQRARVEAVAGLWNKVTTKHPPE